VIIFLNGTSSSGKTTIARELLDVLDELYFHVPVDAFHVPVDAFHATAPS
jgi:chloramphenicol 3-O phosphotransferase